MGIFDIRKPRRFHHEYIYYNQRKERLKAVEERAKVSPGMQDASKSAPTDLNERMHGIFIGATRHARRRRERKLAGGLVLSYGVIIVLLVLLAAIWKMLLVL